MQIPAQSPSGENGLGDLCTIGPDSNLGGKQAGKRRASSERASAGSGQCYLRKELGFGHAYFSVGCNQNLLGLTNVWTTLDERRWQARRHFGWKFLIDQAEPTRHTIRIISKENIDGIFFLADFALQIWDVSVRSVQDLLRLQDIKLRGDAVLKAELRQLDRIRLCCDCFVRYQQLLVQLQKGEIVVRDIADQGQDNRLSPVVSSQQLSASSLV